MDLIRASGWLRPRRKKTLLKVMNDENNPQQFQKCSDGSFKYSNTVLPFP